MSWDDSGLREKVRVTYSHIAADPNAKSESSPAPHPRSRTRAIFAELARGTARGGAVFAAELVLKGSPPEGVQSTETDWFS